MRIPILVSGTPSLLKDSKTCKVYLHHGQWKIVSENLVNSIFSIVQDALLVKHNDDIFTGPCSLVILFSHIGSENNLNIYATNDG